MAQELKLKSGSGSVTAALPYTIAATVVTTVAVFTTPADAGYIYEVALSVLSRTTTSGTSATAIARLPGKAGTNVTTSNSTVVDLLPAPTAAAGVLDHTAENGRNVFLFGPATAVTVDIITYGGSSGSQVGTYDISYSYLGKKIVNNSF